MPTEDVPYIMDICMVDKKPNAPGVYDPGAGKDLASGDFTAVAFSLNREENTAPVPDKIRKCSLAERTAGRHPVVCTDLIEVRFDQPLNDILFQRPSLYATSSFTALRHTFARGEGSRRQSHR